MAPGYITAPLKSSSIMPEKRYVATAAIRSRIRAAPERRWAPRSRNVPLKEVATALADLEARVASSAHDLSNALGVIMNYATFLAEDLADTSVTVEYLPHLQRAAQRALDVVAALVNDAR